MTAQTPHSLLRPDLRDIVKAVAGMPGRVSHWRARRRSSPVWTVTVAVILSVMLLPIFAIIWIALGGSTAGSSVLSNPILPESISATLTLAAGLGVVTLIIGTTTAWIVTMYRFPGRAAIDRLLVLPLAIPTYIAAYCYADLLDYAGPVQTSLRHLFGWQSPSDYWFPSIRTEAGAIFVIAAVLYPYVYLTARASFVQQSICVLEVARTLGRTPMGAFWSVALPLARPALAAGTALVLMEGLNDLGAVQHLGVPTLTASIYATWLQRSDLAGAAQLALITLGFIALILAAERFARGKAQSHHTTGRYRSIPFQDIEGWRGYIVAAICLLPFLFGFALPILVLLSNAFHHHDVIDLTEFLRAAGNSIMLAAIAATVAVTIALVLAYARRVAANGFTRPAVRLAGLGYAVPGTVLAVGLLLPLSSFDNSVDALAQDWFGVRTGLLLSGSIFALTLAYVIRFLAVAHGGIDAGLERISPNLDAAARALGETALSALRRIHLPLIIPALSSAGLLVFVDATKELPATLLLRPFDFETLATHVYGLAALERFESAAPGCLAIALVGLLPVLLLHKAVAGGRAGSRNESMPNTPIHT